MHDLETALLSARKIAEAMPLDYYDQEHTLEYKIQEEVRLATRSVHTCATHQIEGNWLLENQLEQTLALLEEAKKLFGTHPFAHVIGGRMISLVQRAHTHCFPIPQVYEDYLNQRLDLQPWKNPHLNYCSLHDLLFPEKTQYIPPEYSGRVAVTLTS